MSTASGSGAAHRPRPFRLRLHGWLRWLHIYISMFSLLAVLFFSLTGITLNHPEWTWGNTERRQDLSGTLPAGWRAGTQVDWLTVAEHLRQAHGVRGTATDRRADEAEASITFKAPGYSADCFIQPGDGSYNLTVTAQGFVGVMNDFHRGRDAGRGWALLIDVSGVLLTVVALTGLGLLWYLKRIRTAALASMAAGGALVWVLMKMAG